MDWVTLALELTTATMEFGTEILKKMPDFDQKKKLQYHKLLKAYKSEIKKDYGVRDDDLIMNLRDQLKDFVTVFVKELNK
jgi:hypothetical protein